MALSLYLRMRGGGSSRPHRGPSRPARVSGRLLPRLHRLQCDPDGPHGGREKLWPRGRAGAEVKDDAVAIHLVGPPVNFAPGDRIEGLGTKSKAATQAIRPLP